MGTWTPLRWDDDLHGSVVQRLLALGLAMQDTARSAGDRIVAERLQDHIEDVAGIISDIRSAAFAVAGHGPCDTVRVGPTGTVPGRGGD